MNPQKVCLISDNHPDPLFLTELLQRGYALTLHQTVPPDKELSDFLNLPQWEGKILRLQTAPSGLFSEFHQHYDHLDLYIKAFSPIKPKPFLEITEDEFQEDNLWNWKSAFFCLCEAARYFSQDSGGGSIILLSSTDQKFTRPGRVISGTISAALSKLVQYAGAELGRYGVQANGIAVGGTEENSPWALPSGKAVSPRDLADTVCLLAATPSLTGNTLFLDGGESLLDDSPQSYGLTPDRILERRHEHDH